MQEELAYRLARISYYFHAEPGEDWNERLHYKVPKLYFMALAEEALEFMKEVNVTERD